MPDCLPTIEMMEVTASASEHFTCSVEVAGECLEVMAIDGLDFWYLKRPVGTGRAYSIHLRRKEAAQFLRHHAGGRRD